MVTRVVVGNISGEATTAAGNILLESMRQHGESGVSGGAQRRLVGCSALLLHDEQTAVLAVWAAADVAIE